MKAVIIVFSPSGHTLIAAHMIQKKIKDKGGTADIIKMTGCCLPQNPKGKKSWKNAYKISMYFL